MEKILRVPMIPEFYKIVPDTNLRKPLFHFFQQISDSNTEIKDTTSIFAKRYSLYIIKTDSHLVNYIT